MAFICGPLEACPLQNNLHKKIMSKARLLEAPKNLATAQHIQLNSSKSISNRLLIIQAIMEQWASNKSLSKARDSQTLLRLLQQEDQEILDAGDAGTSFRFLTAYLCLNDKKQVLTGSARMLERPIGPLVDALRSLGAQIDYLGQEGYPPLQIGAAQWKQSTEMPSLSIDGGISSQYISALLLIAPVLPQGLRLQLTGEIISMPYIQMTLGLMERFGIAYLQAGKSFLIEPQNYQAPEKEFMVEGDWSAAAYYYALVALAPVGFELQLGQLQKNSLQGDAIIAELLDELGVTTEFLTAGKLRLRKRNCSLPSSLRYDCRHYPDLAQTLMAIAAVLNIPCQIFGLQSLRIKETDRLAAMKTELEKLGAEVEIGPDWMNIKSGLKVQPQKPFICTYKDHRMAMALAPLALLLGPLKFEQPEVVAKSYPAFWTDLAQLGFKLS